MTTKTIKKRLSEWEKKFEEDAKRKKQKALRKLESLENQSYIYKEVSEK